METATMTEVFVFPGQGSQSLGMGQGLFEQFPEQTQIASEILGYSISKLCLEDPQEELNQTQFTQPALYVVNALSFLAKGQTADIYAGHSLGEYNALFAAGVFDFATGLKLVQKRGELMSQVSGGGMAAVIGLSEDQISKSLAEAGLETIDIANINSPKQIVISGLKADIEKAASPIENAGAKRFVPLNVSGAFHSRYMKDSAEQFAQFLEGFSFNAPQVPVVANATAEGYSKDTVAELLSKQIYSSVLWLQSIQKIQATGPSNIQEVGPGKVLTGLTRQIARG